MGQEPKKKSTAEDVACAAQASVDKVRAALDRVENKLLFQAEELTGIQDRIDRLNQQRKEK